jgi:hypothetical protein
MGYRGILFFRPGKANPVKGVVFEREARRGIHVAESRLASEPDANVIAVPAATYQVKARGV